jgi:hypothetical protein
MCSVYYKPPEAFVKKLRDIQNRKEKDEQDEEPEELLSKDQRALNTVSQESIEIYDTKVPIIAKKSIYWPTATTTMTIIKM